MLPISHANMAWAQVFAYEKVAGTRFSNNFVLEEKSAKNMTVLLKFIP